MIAQIRKALVAGGAVTASTLGGLMSDGSVTGAEVCIAVGAGLVAGAAVWRVPNATDVTPDPSDEEPVDGEIPAAFILERHFRVGG